MSHDTLINGTSYQIVSGKTFIGGTAYSIAGGNTLIGGTVRNIPFSNELVVYDGGDTVKVGTLEYFMIGAGMAGGQVGYYKNKCDYIPVTEDGYIYTEKIQQYAAQGYGFYHIMGIDFTQYSQLHFTFVSFYGGVAGYSTEGLYGPSDGTSNFYNPIYEDSISSTTETDITFDISAVTGEKCLMFRGSTVAPVTVMKIWLE